MPVTIPTYDPATDELLPVDYFTVDEVAELLPVSASTIRRHVKAEEWPALVVERTIYMTKRHVGRCIELMTQEVTPVEASQPPPRIGTPVTGPDVESIQ